MVLLAEILSIRSFTSAGVFLSFCAIRYRKSSSLPALISRSESVSSICVSFNFSFSSSQELFNLNGLSMTSFLTSVCQVPGIPDQPDPRKKEQQSQNTIYNYRP